MLYKLILLLSLSQATSGSLVVDSTAQRSIYVTDYCPKMNFCPEGAHVMCMYYNAKSKLGPRCGNAQNISMTPEIANKLVDVSNAVRSRIAQGKEKGKNGEILPRGFGIFRLNWDSELATFAQVLANQCVLRHDLCRATNRFPDPGQTAGLVRFSYPDWFPVSKSGNFTIPGLDPAKLMYATTQILKSWYGQKNAVTSNMMTYYPDWTLNPNNQNGRLYLEMIYGSATHMGCGISAYTEYAFYDNNAALNYNSVQIICNYSARPRKGTAVYNTVPPGDTAVPFSRCGCPVGSEADEECLCKEVNKEPKEPPMVLKHTRDCPDGEVCDPTVVVLPIFTVEDAPPEKLFTHESFSNPSLKHSIDTTFASSENDLFTIKRNHQPDEIVNKPQAKYNNALQKQSRLYNRKQNKTILHHPGVMIRNRYYDKKHMEMKPQERGRPQNVPRKKTSIFNRVAKFELPKMRIYSLIKDERKKPEIKDVVPRKDFTDAKELVSKYYYGRNDRQIILPLYKDIIHEEKNTFNEHVPPKTEKNIQVKLTAHDPFKVDNKHNLHEVFNILKATKPLQANQEIMKYQKLPTTETVLNTAEQKLITDDTFLKGIVSNAHDYNSPFKSVTEESDNKLMALLDTLEQEVKHIELRDKDKQLFDAKIRKIYGKVVGKPVSLLDFHINNPDTKPNETRRANEAQDYYVIQKSIQQDLNEVTNKHYNKIKKERLDELDVRSEARIRMNDKFKNNSMARDRIEPEKVDEKSLYIKGYNKRGMKHSGMSHEQMRERYYDYENEHEDGERKTVKNINFDINTLTDLDEPRQRGTDRYRSRINERGRYIDDEVEHKGRRVDHYLKNDDNELMRNKNYYLSNGAGNDDPMSTERRRFYQEKLNNIDRRLQMRNHKRRKNTPRHMRPMRPATRKSENQMDIYGRARFAHGY